MSSTQNGTTFTHNGGANGSRLSHGSPDPTPSSPSDHADHADHAASSTRVSPYASGADRARTIRRAGLALCFVLAGGMLIWFKLRVVTGVPRQAYADPETQQTDQKKQPASNGAQNTGTQNTGAQNNGTQNNGTRSTTPSGPRSK